MLAPNPAFFADLDRICDASAFDGVHFTWSIREERLVQLALWIAKHAPITNQAGHPTKSVDGWCLLAPVARIKYHREALGLEKSCCSFIESLKDAEIPEERIHQIVTPRLIGNWKDWFQPLSESEPIWKTDFERYVWKSPDEDILDLVNGLGVERQALISALERFRADLFQKWNRSQVALESLRESDEEICRLLEAAQTTYMLFEFDRLKPGEFHEQKVKAALRLSEKGGLLWLAQHEPETMLSRVNEMLAAGIFEKNPNLLHSKVLEVCAKQFGGDGKSVLRSILAPGRPWYSMNRAIEALVTHGPSDKKDDVSDYCRRALELLDPGVNWQIWQVMSRNPVFLEPYLSDLKEILENRKLPRDSRTTAYYCLAKYSKSDFADYCRDLITSGEKLKVTLAFELLGESHLVNGKQILMEILPSAKPKAFRDRILKKLDKLGVDISIYQTGDSKKEKPMLDKAVPKNQRRPIVKLFDLSSLPLLRRRDGTTMSEAAAWFLIEKQKNHREVERAPEVSDLLELLDPKGNTGFAMSVLNGFLDSDQKASDRWALAVAGMLGDSQVIHPLLSRIQGWCDHSRCKLAEYAAQAICLLPGNEPLMVLDTLSNRYRSKFKNVGRACAEAFTAAATARGITPDELGDLVVPDFGFDSEGIRRFDWDGGGVSAELGADFKLTWFDPETDKNWKSLPANAPDEVKTEVKTLGKLLRETVKGQTTRLDMALVRQRRWPVARWRELFENHPLLRSFASGLVWGVYDSSGKLLRTFRRYANGILADASGTMEELPETDSSIGMVHPLELDPPLVDAWRAHLSRMKVKPPFSQLDRPVELMDPLHANRREISLTKERKLSAGTFRSRAEKRGWVRGSVVDAGGIASYYKLYPGAGVEVNLPTDNFWIGCDPMETIELGAACFAKAGTIERGSYIYNEPAPDDPRVLRFDQVPVVVYSETLADLKAIIATKE